MVIKKYVSVLLPTLYSRGTRDAGKKYASTSFKLRAANKNLEKKKKKTKRSLCEMKENKHLKNEGEKKEKY